MIDEWLRSLSPADIGVLVFAATLLAGALALAADDAARRLMARARRRATEAKTQACLKRWCER